MVFGENRKKKKKNSFTTSQIISSLLTSQNWAFSFYPPWVLVGKNVLFWSLFTLNIRHTWFFDEMLEKGFLLACLPNLSFLPWRWSKILSNQKNENPQPRTRVLAHFRISFLRRSSFFFFFLQSLRSAVLQIAAATRCSLHYATH